MFYKKIIKSFLFLFILTFFCNSIFSSIANLKETYSILKDPYKHLSVINGAVADESGFTMRLYDYGAMKDKTIEIREQQYQIPDIKNALETVKLVHLFYHRVPGTTGRGDFVLKKELANNPNKIQLSKELAKAISILEKESTKYNETGFITQIDKQGLIKQGGKNVIRLITVKSMTPIYASLLEEFDTKGHPKSPLTTNAIFPQNTTLTILLSVLYRLCGNNKEALKVFYEELNNLINKDKKEPESIFINDKIPEDWKNEEFDLTKYENYKEVLSSLENPEKIVEHFETLVYLAFLPTNYPPIENYISANFFYDDKDPFKKKSFPDCMDNTFRNIINVLTYNHVTKEFDPGILAQKIQKEDLQTFNATLVDFYKDPILKQSTESGSQKAHDKWINVISNIPFVTYANNTNKPYTASSSMSYINIPEEFKNHSFFKGKEYQFADNAEILYEIEPSLKNLIMVFNYLFGLQLFENEEGEEIEKTFNAFIRNDFIKHYFPLMCKHLKINYKWINVTEDDIDNVDFQEIPIITKLIFNPYPNAPEFKLKTTNHVHGEFSLLSSGDATTGIDLMTSRLYFIFPLQDNRLFILPYLCCSLFPNESTKFLYKFSAPRLFEALFWLPINNPDFVKKLVTKRFKLSKCSLNLLYYLINKIPDPLIRQTTLINFNLQTINTSEQIDEESIQEAIKTATSGLKIEDTAIREKTFELWKILFKKNHGFESAEELAKNGFESKDYYTRQTAIDLFKTLFEYKKSFAIAQEIAIQKLESDNLTCKSNGLLLLDILIQQEYDFYTAINILEKILKEDIPPHLKDRTRTLYINLFEKLKNQVQKNQNFDIAINVATNGILSSNILIRIKALSLWKNLFDKGKGFEKAAEVCDENKDKPIKQLFDLKELVTEERKRYSESQKVLR